MPAFLIYFVTLAAEVPKGGLVLATLATAGAEIEFEGNTRTNSVALTVPYHGKRLAS